MNPPDRSLLRLWAGVLLPPAAWVFAFMARYFVIRFANIHDRRWPMIAATAVGLVLWLTGAALCWRARREGERDASGTLAVWGLGLAAFFLLLIFAEAVPTFLLDPREIT